MAKREMNMILPLLLLAVFTVRGFGYSEGPPRIIEQPSSLVVQRQKPVTLQCRTVGHPTPTVQWYKNGRPLHPADRRTLLTDGGLLILHAHVSKRDSDAGVYWCEASNMYGTVRSRNATLQVAVLRTDFRLNPKFTRGMAGETVLLECSPPRGSPEPVVSWKKNNQVMDLTNNERIRIVDGGNLIIQDVRKSDGGNYACVAENAAALRESDIALLQVVVKPYLIEGPSDTVGLVGSSVVFHCRVGGEPLPEVLWTRSAGGGNMPVGRVHILEEDEEDSGIRLDDVTVADEGDYICRAKNPYGYVTSTGVLTVHSPPALKIRPVSQSVEVGSEAFYECNAAGNPKPTLFWSFEGNNSLIFPGVVWDRFESSISPNGTSKLTLEAARKADSGTTVVCSAVNLAGAVTGRAKLLVTSEDDSPPPIILQGPSNQTLPVKSIAEFPCSAVGVPEPVISWYHKTTPLISSRKVNISDSGNLKILYLDKEDSGLYTCVASNKNGKYVWSATLKVDMPTNPSINFFKGPEVSSLPGAPDRPQIRNQSESSVTLTWNQNSKSGSSSILGYQIEMFGRDSSRSGKYEAKWIIVAKRVQETSYTQRLLSAGGIFVFFVRAENAHGFSPPSPLSETILAGEDNEVIMRGDDADGTALIAEARASLQAEEVVKLYDVISVESTMVKLAWETINSFNLDGYYIYYRPLDGVNITVGSYTQQTILYSGSTSDFSISGLNKYTEYEFFLVPFYKNIDGRPSNSRIARTLEDVPSAPPTNLEAFLLNSTAVYLKWKPPPAGTANGVIQEYSVVVRTGSPNSSVVVHNSTVVGGSMRLAGLGLGRGQGEGDTYWLQLAAATTKGRGPYSEPAALRLPLGQGILDQFNRELQDQNSRQVDPGDLMTETWFLALLGSMITMMSFLFMAALFVRRKHILAQKVVLTNLYDSRSTGTTSLVTHLNIKSSPGLKSSYNQSNITKTDSLMWMDNRPSSWKHNGKESHDHPNLPEYDKINPMNCVPDYAEVDAAMVSYRQQSLNGESSVYPPVNLVENPRNQPGTMAWIQMCTGSKNKMNEDPDEEVYPSNNGGYYNRNVFTDSYFSSDRPSMFKFDASPTASNDTQSVNNSNLQNTSGRKNKERVYSVPHTPCGTIRRSHRLKVAKPQNNNGRESNADGSNTYHEIRTQENPTFGLVDDNDCRLTDMPDDCDDKQYFANVQPMKLINHHYSRPTILKTGKANGLSSFSTLKSPSHPKPEYHSSTRSEPGNN